MMEHGLTPYRWLQVAYKELLSTLTLVLEKQNWKDKLDKGQNTEMKTSKITPPEMILKE